MANYNRGDWVIYIANDRLDLGRVADSDNGYGVCQVCFGVTCHKEPCAVTRLHPYTPTLNSPICMQPGIGYHLFDPMGCPDYNPCICSGNGCKPREREFDE